MPQLEVGGNSASVCVPISPGPEASEEPLPPTPHYNSTLLRETGAMERHLSEVFSAVQECPAMSDAIVLCKAWLRQRALDQVGSCSFVCTRYSYCLPICTTDPKVQA